MIYSLLFFSGLFSHLRTGYFELEYKAMYIWVTRYSVSLPGESFFFFLLYAFASEISSGGWVGFFLFSMFVLAEWISGVP